MRQGDVASVHESLSASLAFDLDTERLGTFERKDEGGRLRERREERPAKRDPLIPDSDQVGIPPEAALFEGKDRPHGMPLQGALEVHPAKRRTEVLLPR